MTRVAFDKQLAVPKANFAWGRGLFTIACLSLLGLSDLATHAHIGAFLKTTSLLSSGVVVLCSLTSVQLWIAAIN